VSATGAPEINGAAILRGYLSLLRRRWLLVFVIIMLVLGAALAYTALATPTYQSQAEILVRGAGGPLAADSGADSANLETERQVVLSTAVAERARKPMHFTRSTVELLTHVSVTVPAATQILTITFSSADPAIAQQGAQAFAEAYLAYRQERALQAVTGASAVVQRRIGALQEPLRKANATLADPDAIAVERQQATATRDSLIGQISALQVQLAAVSTVDIDPGEVIEPASLPKSPTAPNPALNVTGGLLLGVILAVALAVVRDRSVETLGGRQGLEKLLDRPVFGAIPNDLAWKDRTMDRQAILENPDGEVAEAYRALATKLVVLAKRHDIKTVAVISPSTGEGKTATVANLAPALADADQRVLAVSGDTRRPRLHNFFGVSNEVGLLNVLADEVAIEEPMRSLPPSQESNKLADGEPRLDILASGHAFTHSGRGLSADALGNLLKDLRDRYDFVILDAPPALLMADALAIAASVDGVLVLADAVTTKPASIRRLLEQLDHVNARVLGGILNRNESPRRAGRSGYHTEA
jgi:capsular exopolysaccharide synthesis family protein